MTREKAFFYLAVLNTALIICVLMFNYAILEQARTKEEPMIVTVKEKVFVTPTVLPTATPSALLKRVTPSATPTVTR